MIQDILEPRRFRKFVAVGNVLLGDPEWTSSEVGNILIDHFVRLYVLHRDSIQ